MPIFRPGPGPYALAISMSGVRLGERLLEIGSGTPGMFAALAAKVGVSGRAAAVVEDRDSVSALEQAGLKVGVLVEVQQAPPSAMSYESEAFDLVVLDRTRMTVESAALWLPEAYRVLRSGGRLLIAERLAASGLRSLFTTASPAGAARAATAMLEANGFRPVRVLAERDAWRFTEGMKPRL